MFLYFAISPFLYLLFLSLPFFLSFVCFCLSFLVSFFFFSFLFFFLIFFPSLLLSSFFSFFFRCLTRLFDLKEFFSQHVKPCSAGIDVDTKKPCWHVPFPYLFISFLSSPVFPLYLLPLLFSDIFTAIQQS